MSQNQFMPVVMRFLACTIAVFLCGTVEHFAQKAPQKSRTAPEKSSTAPQSTPASETPPPTPQEITRKDSLAMLAKADIVRLATIPKEQHQERAKLLFTLLRLEQYPAVMKHLDTSAIAVREAQLEQIWVRAMNIAGKFRVIQEISSERLAVGDVVTVEASFENLSLLVKFNFNDQHKIIGLGYNQGKPKYELPRYASTESIEEREITVKTGDLTMPGTLALPKSTGEKRVPIAILLHDQGPQDRDLTYNGYKPNKDLAFGLGKRGIATLRYDKRTRLYQIKPEEMNSYTVNEETIADAVSAIQEVRALARKFPIDTSKIFIVAPSLAAMVLPRIFRQDSMASPVSIRLAGAVMMALNYVKLHELMMPRFEHFSARDGLTVEEVKQQASIKRRIETVESSKLSLKTSVYDLPYGIPASYWIDLRSYNHVEAIAKLALPMLFLYAEQDHDIDFTANGLAWKTKLAGKSGVEWKSYSNLFHFFAEGNGTVRDYDRKGNVDTAVIMDIADWIEKR